MFWRVICTCEERCYKINYKNERCKHSVGQFFANVFLRQTRKFWNRFGILLPRHLTPEFQRLKMVFEHFHQISRFFWGGKSHCHSIDNSEIWALPWSTASSKSYICIMNKVVVWTELDTRFEQAENLMG